MQNPSTLSTGQNRELRDALAGGTLRFCRINAETAVTSDAATPSCGPLPAGNSSDLSWAIVEEFTTPVRGFLLHIDRISVSNTLRGYLNLRFHMMPTQIESRIMRSQRTISQVSWMRLHQSRPTEYESESILSLILARVGRYWGERVTYQRQTSGRPVANGRGWMVNFPGTMIYLFYLNDLPWDVMKQERTGCSPDDPGPIAI